MEGKRFELRYWAQILLILVLCFYAKAGIGDCDLKTSSTTISQTNAILTVELTLDSSPGASFDFYIRSGDWTKYPLSTFFSAPSVSGVTGTATISGEFLKVSFTTTSATSYIISLTPFFNPPDICSRDLFCQETTTNGPSDIWFTSTIIMKVNTLSSLSLSPDPSSTVGGIWPVTIKFIPSKFPSTGVIVITGMTLSTSTCTVGNKVNIADCTCDYSSNTITITVSSLSGGAASTSSEIAFSISNVQYNTQMSAKSFSVHTGTSATCKSEEATNSVNWVPQKPAPFNTKSFNFFSSATTSTCAYTSLIWQFQPTVEIGSGQLVKIEMIGDIYPTTGFSFAQLNSLTVSGQKITGTTIGTWSTSSSTPAKGFYFVLPPTVKSFSSKITTFAGTTDSDSEIVHQDTTTTLVASSNTTSTTYEIAVTGNVVSDTGLYTLTHKITCGMTTAAVFYISVPAEYSAQTPICTSPVICTYVSGQQFKMTGAVSSAKAADVNLVLSFQLTNPPSIKPVSSTWTVLCYDYSSYQSFSLSSTLALPQTMASGTFKDFKITPLSARAGATTNYAISVKVRHTIPALSTLEFAFPASVVYASAQLVSVTVDATTKSGSSVQGSLKVTNAFDVAVTTDQVITVTFSGITNPLSVDTFSGFTATAKLDTYDIDTSTAATLVISDPAEATITGGPGDLTNSKSNTYSFVFISPTDVTALSTDSYNIQIKKPTEVSSCDYASVAATYPALLTISGSTPVDSSTINFKVVTGTTATKTFAFSVTCTNPPSTKESGDFTFTLYKSANGGNPLCSGTKTVTTSIGSALTMSSSLQSTPKYPKYTTSSSFQITRPSVASSPSIMKIEVQVPNLLSTSPCAAVVDSGTYSCSYSSSTVVILFTSAQTASSFTISGLKSTNPEKTTDTTTPTAFSIKTYTFVDPKFFLVDQLDNGGTLTVTCNHPCKTCTSGTPTACILCDDITTPRYYWYEGVTTNICVQEDSTVCGAGYFKDTTNYKCLKCASTCSECSTSISTCTKCTNTAYVVLNGVCQASCGDGYYLPSGSVICQSCTSPCSKCSGSGGSCNDCIPTYYLDGTLCTQDCGVQKYKDVLTNTCKACQSPCYNCAGTATTCTSCVGLYFTGSTCKTEAECIADKKHVINTSEWKCEGCSANCNECQTTSSTCTSCTGTLALSGNLCVGTCPTNQFISSNVCTPCSTTCNGCVGTADRCTACAGSTYLEDGTYSCVLKCKTNYYLSASTCFECNSACYTCSQNALSCTSCTSGKYLSGNTCVSQCPSGTYGEGTVCTQCAASCATCSGASTTCLTCAANMYVNSNTCVSSCPSGKTAISSICQDCTGQCATCSGVVDYCTSCKTTTEYVYGGKCYTSCPSNTTATQVTATIKSCTDCDKGCDTCFWATVGNSTVNKTALNCSKCSSGMKFLDYKCYSVCPTNYTVSSDGLSCNANSNPSPNQNTTTNYTSSNPSSTSFIPFPHLISAFVLIIVSIWGQVRDPRSVIISNLIILWSFVIMTCYCIQAFLAFLKEETLILLVTAGAVVLAVLLDLFFNIAYKIRIAKDNGFLLWSNAHGCTKVWIISLSSIFSFQISRLYYSRFMGFSLFFAQFTDFWSIFGPLNCFSLCSLILTYFPIVAIDVYALTFLTWSSQLYVTVIESLILSLVILILICYEIRYGKKTQDEISMESAYAPIKDDSNLSQNGKEGTKGKGFNEEEMRKKILEDVFARLGLSRSDIAKSDIPDGKDTSRNSPLTFKPGKPKRRRSFPSKSGNVLEKDPREAHSYPSSPKTAKRKEVPLKQYGIKDPDEKVDPDDLEDNVYSEVKPPSDPNVINVKPMAEAGVQTPPFQKIAAFKKHMLAQDRNKKKKGKLFEYDVNGEKIKCPLDAIEEAPEGEDDILNKPSKGNEEPKKESTLEDLRLNDAQGDSPKKDGGEKEDIIKKDSSELKGVVLMKKPEDAALDENNLEINPEDKKEQGTDSEQLLNEGKGKGNPELSGNKGGAGEQNKMGEEGLSARNQNKLGAGEPNELGEGDKNKFGVGEKNKLGAGGEDNLGEGEENKAGAGKGKSAMKGASAEPDFNAVNEGGEAGALPELASIPGGSGMDKKSAGGKGLPESKNKQSDLLDTFMIQGGEPPVSEGEKDSSKAGMPRRNVHSPPQKIQDASDSLITEPLNPVEDSKKRNTGINGPDEVRNSILVSPRPDQTPSEEEERKRKEDLANKTLADKHKTPEVFEDNDGFEFSITNIKPENIEPKKDKKEDDKKKVEGKEEDKQMKVAPSFQSIPSDKEPKEIDDAEIMGSFDRDPNDNCILIREDPDGKLVDLRNRRVNRHGYLVDDDGNIINRKGEIILRKEEIAHEFGDDQPREVPHAPNQLFPDEKNPSGVKEGKNEEGKEITPVENMKKEGATGENAKEENADDDDNGSRKSVSVDSLMGDTPSNYNIQNQRYEDPLENIKQRSSKALLGRPPPLRHKEVEYAPPGAGDIKLAKAYGGQARGPPKRPKRSKDKSKSANKREAEKIFQAARRVSGFGTDAENHPDDLSLPRLKSEIDNKGDKKDEGKEETKDVRIGKPETARSKARATPNDGKRSKSRKATRRDSKNNSELQKIYGDNIEDMFLHSDEDDGMSIASMAPSNMSKASNKNFNPKLKGLENIYLQRLESSKKHQKTNEKRGKMKRIASRADKGPDSVAAGSDSERDEISSLLSENYAAMHNQFFQAGTQPGGNALGKQDSKQLFPGNLKLYPPESKQ